MSASFLTKLNPTLRRSFSHPPPKPHNFFKYSQFLHQTHSFSQTASTTFQHRTYSNILVDEETHISDGVSIITLNRAKALNALCNDLLSELVHALQTMQHDDRTRCIVLTGAGTKAFCAGADIKEMLSCKSYMEAYQRDMFTIVDEIPNKVKKPIIAAVNGFALGGGCELMMLCDIAIASTNAKFGQPEIKLGTIPGIGGTQRLTRAIGKSKAMEMCLTGDLVDAHKACEWGLISKVVELRADGGNGVVEEAVEMAKKIAGMSSPIVSLCKACVNQAFEGTLKEGIGYERKLFHSTFSTKDQKEGMSAFSEKRQPNWNHE